MVEGVLEISILYKGVINIQHSSIMIFDVGIIHK